MKSQDHIKELRIIYLNISFILHSLILTKLNGQEIMHLKHSLKYLDPFYLK